MARAKKDPRQQAIDEIADVRTQGKTELSISVEDENVLEEIWGLKALTKLRLSTGALTKLPPGIGRLAALESLHMESNQLTELPADIGKLAKLQTLYAYSNKIEKVPDEIGGCVELRDLSLWSNKLTSLPAGIGGLAKLRDFSIKWNEVTALPKEIGRLVELEELDAENNKLADLPAEFGKLAKLRELKLTKNALKKFPAALTELSALEMLLMGENEIDAIPDGIVKMKKLRELTMPKNKVSVLPEPLFQTNIAVLGVSSNQLKTIPKSIGGMKGLVGIAFGGNPLEGIPETVVEGGKDALFEHLGLTKALEMTGDLPPEEERKAIVKKSKDRLEQFVRDTKRKLTDEKMRDTLMDFLMGKTSKVPPGRLKDHYSFGHISEALLPYPEWNFIDRRILRFITQAAWYYTQPGHSYQTGYHKELFHWLDEQIEEETDPGLFGKIAKELAACGIDEVEILFHAIDTIPDRLLAEDKKTPTSFGRWVLENAKTRLPRIIEAAQTGGTSRTGVTTLLMEHDPASFAKAAPTLLEIKPDSDGEIHIPYAALRTVCAKDPAPYEALLLDGIARTDCMPCKAEGIRILAESYGKKYQEKAFAATCEVLKYVSEKKNKGERYDFPWSQGERWGDGAPQFIAWTLKTFGAQAKKPVFEYAENTKVFDLDVAEVVAKALGQEGIDIIAEGLSMKIDDDSLAAHYRRMFTILAPLDWSKYHEKAWEIAQNEHRKVRETACLALSRLGAKAVFAKAKELLDAKKAHEREAGVMILGLLGTPEAKKILVGLLDTEKGDDARDLIVTSVYEKAESIGLDEIERRVESAKERGKLARPVAKWIDEKKLPAPSWTGGKKKVSADTLRFLLQRQTRQTGIAIDPEARDVFAKIDRASAGDLAVKLLALVMKNGGPAAKTRFALSVIGRLGDERVIESLEEIAIEKRNENAVATIGLLGTLEAARALDRIAKVFRVKYPNVREVAQEGFGLIADSLGKTPFELADAMLPDFGFKKGKLTQPFAAGKRKLSLAIGAHRKPGLLDEDGEPLKSPPKDVNAKQKTALKDLGVAVRGASRQLTSSLEYYLIVGRRWSAEDWSAFFLENALPFAYARSLVWATYKGRAVQKTFRVTADGESTDAGGGKVSVKGATIGLVHPLELKADERKAWQAVLDGDGLVPPFAQMARPVFAVPDEDREKKLCFMFEGKEVYSSTLKRRAERLGWRRGSVVDSGEVSAHKKTYTTDVIDVFVRHEGVGVQSFMDGDSEATLKDFFFVKSGSVVTGSYTYDEPRDESDERLMKMSEVPAIVYSETVADLHVIAGTKNEEDDDDE